MAARSMVRSVLAVVLLLAVRAGAEGLRPGLGAGVGMYPASEPNLLASPRFDVELDQELTPFAALRLTMVATTTGAMFAPGVDLGARWHVTDHVTLGLALSAALSFLGTVRSTVRPAVGFTIEPLVFRFARHHEVGLSLAVLWPTSEATTEPFFSALLFPAVGWTWRF